LGAFHIDANGYLVLSNGFRVQGLSDYALTEFGEIVIDSSGAPGTADPAATVASITINHSGEISVALSDGTHFTRGQILLQWYRDPHALRLSEGELYTNLDAALPIFSLGLPGTMGLGTIESGALESIPHLPKLQLLPQTGVRLLVTELSSIPFVASTIESSPDLAHWTPIGKLADPADNIDRCEFFDTRPTSAGKIFYRVRQTFGPGTGGTKGRQSEDASANRLAL
jgi:hypothetical protein